MGDLLHFFPQELTLRFQIGLKHWRESREQMNRRNVCQIDPRWVEIQLKRADQFEQKAIVISWVGQSEAIIGTQEEEDSIGLSFLCFELFREKRQNLTGPNPILPQVGDRAILTKKSVNISSQCRFF